jgi:hypothetical protein
MSSRRLSYISGLARPQVPGIYFVRAQRRTDANGRADELADCTELSALLGLAGRLRHELVTLLLCVLGVATSWGDLADGKHSDILFGPRSQSVPDPRTRGCAFAVTRIQASASGSASAAWARACA